MRLWRKSRLHGVVLAIAAGAGGYAALAYLLLPAFWTSYERARRPPGQPMVTHTAQGLPGDPLNIGLVGTRTEVVRAMAAAGWSAAAPITLRSSLEIIDSVLLDRPDPTAPVSALYYDGRPEDLAFEKEAGRSADRRHHLRLWEQKKPGADGRPLWLGAATFDAGLGLSRYTGAVTHRIAPDVDAERDRFVADLVGAGVVEVVDRLPGIGPVRRGRNGEGDPYFTDGDIRICRLRRVGEDRSEPVHGRDSGILQRARTALARAVARLWP